jgi:GR25 family glycosyltransferase involved in LPS biosynthesis
MSVDKIYVINLNRRPDRLQEFKSRCPIDISKIEIFSAIDGRKYSSYDLDNVEKHLYNIAQRKSNGIGACGCFSSHYRIWKKIANDGSLSELSKIIVYEDDAFFTDNYMHKINDINSISDFDILYIGGRFRKNYLENNKVLGISKISGQRTTHAYVITKKGAIKILDYIKNNIVSTVEVDTFLNNLKSKLDMYDLYPHINWSPLSYKTDIQLNSIIPIPSLQPVISNHKTPLKMHKVSLKPRIDIGSGIPVSTRNPNIGSGIPVSTRNPNIGSGIQSSTRTALTRTVKLAPPTHIRYKK